MVQVTLVVHAFVIHGFLLVLRGASISYPQAWCRVGPLSCVCSFTDSLHHFDFRGPQIKASHGSENPVLHIFLYMRQFAGTQPLHVMRVTCTIKQTYTIVFVFSLSPPIEWDIEKEG
jgi:hypothetical protein